MGTLLIPLLSLRPASASGIAFARHLLPHLVAAHGKDDVVVLTDHRCHDLLRELGCRFEVHRIPDARLARLAAQRLLIPAAIARHRPAALYVPDGQTLGAPVTIPAVIALHHHLNFSRPQGMGLAHRAYWRLWFDGQVRRSVARAAALTAPTQAFAHEVEELLPRSRGKLVVIPHGVASELVAGALGVARNPPNVVAVSNEMAYKNLEGTLRIFLRAAEGLPHRLRVAGVDGRGLERAARRAGVAASLGRFDALGRLAPSALGAVYGGASALLLPSFVESFGLPVVEAMACGAPVACSDLPSLREVAAGAAFLADPHDEPAFAASLRQLLVDDALARARREAGLVRAGAFRWDEAGRRTAELCRTVAVSG